MGNAEAARKQVLSFVKPLESLLAQGDVQGVLVVYVAPGAGLARDLRVRARGGRGNDASPVGILPRAFKRAPTVPVYFLKLYVKLLYI